MVDSTICSDAQAVSLLAKAGWIPEDAGLDGAALTATIESFQSWWGLYVDGSLGPKTFEVLSAPRFCRHPDIFDPPQALGGSINRWGKNRLAIELVGSLGSLTDADFREGVITGARRWSEVCGLSFDLVNERGDIRIDTGRIDGRGKVLGYMQLPPTDGFTGVLEGRGDDDEGWTFDLVVAVFGHEVGHGIGIGHSNIPRQWMNPTLSNIVHPQAAFDIPQSRSRYGGPVVVVTPPPPPPPPDPTWNEIGWMPLPGTAAQFNLRWPKVAGLHRYDSQ